MRRTTRLLVEALESRINLNNFNLAIDEVLASPDVVPGSDLVVTARLSNEGMMPYGGKPTVHVTVFGHEYDFTTKIGIPAARMDNMMNTVPGKSQVTVRIRVPSLDFNNPGAGPGSYPVNVFIDPITETINGMVTPEMSDTDNTGLTGINYSYQFGTVGGEKNVKLTAASATGDVVFGLSGPGTGQIDLNGGIADLSFTGTGATSKGSTAGVGSVALHNITAGAVMKEVDLDRVNASGDLNFAGLLKLKLANYVGDNTTKMTIGPAAGQAVNLQFDRLKDVSVDATAVAIEKFQAGEWLDSEMANVAGKDALRALAMGTLKIDGKAANTSGDFDPSVLIDPNHTRPLTSEAIGEATIAGAIEGSFWNAGDENVGNISAGSAINWQLIKVGKLNRVTIKGDWTDTNSNLSAAKIGALTVGGRLQLGSLSISLLASGARIPSIDKLTVAKEAQIGALGFLGMGGIGGFGIGTISVGSWPSGTMAADWIKTIKVTDGPFGPDVKLSGYFPTSNTRQPKVPLNTASINGTLSGSWAVSEPTGQVGTISASQIDNWKYNDDFLIQGGSTIKSLQVFGTVSNSTIKATSIGQFRAQALDTVTLNLIGDVAAGKRSLGNLTVFGAIKDSNISLDHGATAITANQFAGSTVTTPETIGTFNVKGQPGGPGPYFSSTTVSAGTIGILTLHDVDPANHGVFNTGFVKNYTRFAGTTETHLGPLDGPGSFDEIQPGQFMLQIT